MPVQTQRRTVRIGHSPDPDDAFMWYPLARTRPGDNGSGDALIDTGEFDFVHILEDIQSLNKRAENGELEITAISIHQYAHVRGQYALTSCGSSMGDSYGPMVVAPKDSPLHSVDHLTRDHGREITIAIPGDRTTAFLVLQLLLQGAGRYRFESVAFDEILPAVTAGQYDAGLIIHEGQLTYAETGLNCVVDLGEWWTTSRGLPLPLGGNAIRRDLADQMRPICTVLRRSIEYALEHRQEALEYALQYARGMGIDLADRFVTMYVNQWTLDYGDTGRRAVNQLLQEASDAGLIPPVEPVDWVEPG